MTSPYPTAEYPAAPVVQRSWWRRRSPLAKVGLAAAAVLVLLCVGGVAIAAGSGGSPDRSPAKAAVNPADVSSQSPTVTTTSAAAPAQPSPAASATPKIEKRTVTETVRIPFTTKTVKDSSLPKGTSKIRTRGVAGVKTLTYQVTLTDGAQTSKTLLRQQITKQPVTQVVAIGTKQTQQCDPNYSGACVPIASDVDCAGGGGNGPAYVQGPVRVIGTDIYDLDRDGDGIGCD
ncbi:MAG TPA: G5 domain-containing protein [Vicinamibacterales bacterium]|jgi:hypothetical protein